MQNPACQDPHMKPSCKKLYEAMQSGEEISVKTSIMRHGISAAGQRMTELRNKYGVDVRDRWAIAPNGARYKIYFLPPALQAKSGPKPAAVFTWSISTRRHNALTGAEPADIQQNLFR